MSGWPICSHSPPPSRDISRGPEALYDGSNHNLIGVRNFLSGTPQLAVLLSGTPQLAVLLGMTRAGKSAFVCDLLSQTDPYYDFTLIVEEGLSYGIWTQAQCGTPIVIQPDGDLTLNYFDTRGAPLTNLQITTAAALVAKMAGHPAAEDRRSLRLAQITQYIEQLYTDRFEEWFPETLRVSTLLPATRWRWPNTRTRACRSPRRSWRPGRSSDTRFPRTKGQSLVSRWKSEEVSRFLKSAETERLVRNTAFAFFQPTDYPTHDMLQQMLLAAPFPEHNREEINQMATLLAPWDELGSSAGIPH